MHGSSRDRRCAHRISPSCRPFAARPLQQLYTKGPRPIVALRTLVALVLIGFITHSTNAGSGDEPHYLAIAHSIAFDRDLDLANNYGPSEPLIAGGGLTPENHVQVGAGALAVRTRRRPATSVCTCRPRFEAPCGVAVGNRAGTTDAASQAHPHGPLSSLISLVMIAVACWMAGVLFDACLELGAATRTAAPRR